MERKEKHPSGDWSQMPTEILELFCKLLRIPDQVRFGVVCKTWRYSTWSKAYLWVPDTPWLVADENSSSQFKLFSSTDQKNFNIPKPFKDDSFIAASSRGWLVIRSSEAKLFVLNLFSKIRIDLPPRTTVPGSLRTSEEGMDDIHLGFAISTCANLNPINVAGVTFGGGLTWCKIGDTTWKGYQGDDEYGNLTFHNDKLYAIERDGARIGIFKVDDESSVLLPLDTIPVPTDQTPLSDALDVYLVESNGSLLVVKRYYDSSRILGQTIGFDIFKVQSKQIVNVDSLEDQALFMSDLSCESVAAKDCPGLQEGRIYFIGHTTDGYKSELGVFVVQYKRLFRVPLVHTDMDFPIWVLPRFAFECDCKCHDSALFRPQKHKK